VRPRHHRFQQIAQARIAYGGCGQITDVLQPALRANR
jgi:flagellar basal body L-ring protein FlgH